MSQIQLGNARPKLADGTAADLGAPAVTYIDMPLQYFDVQNEDLTGDAAAADATALKGHVVSSIFDQADERQGVTRMEDLGFGKQEAWLSVCHLSSGAWQRHAAGGAATWVHAPDHPVLQQHLADFFRCPVGQPADLEETHFTNFGEPGQGPLVPSDPGLVIPDLQAAIGSGVQGGRDMLSQGQFGWQNSLWISGSATSAPSTTVLTDTGRAFTTNALTGLTVIAPAAGVYGIIQSNTATTITVDRWTSLTNPGGAAGSTPANSAVYAIVAFAPGIFVGLNNVTGTPPTPTTITVLGNEITTPGGGLIRKIAPVAHTAGLNTTTLTPVFTANGTDTLPVTVYSSGQYPTLAAANGLQFWSLLSTSATLSASGDQLTETVTYTGT
jgi:hypothetical protein